MFASFEPSTRRTALVRLRLVTKGSSAAAPRSNRTGAARARARLRLKTSKQSVFFIMISDLLATCGLAQSCAILWHNGHFRQQLVLRILIFSLKSRHGAPM